MGIKFIDEGSPKANGTTRIRFLEEETAVPSAPEVPEGFARRIENAYAEGNPSLAKYLEEEAARVSSAPPPRGFLERIGEGAASIARRAEFEVGRRAENVKEAVTGESRQTPESLRFPDLGFPDASSDLYKEFSKPFNSSGPSMEDLESAGIVPPASAAMAIDAIYSFGGSDEERMKMLRAIPGVGLVPDEKGNVMAIFPNGYVSMLNKPGLSKADLREVGSKGLVYGLGAIAGGRTLGGQILGAMGSQAAMEAGGFAYGGEFNPEEIALAGILEGAGYGLGKGIAAAWGKLTGAQRRGIKSWRDLKGRVSDDEFERLRELKEAEEALPGAPAVTQEQFSVTDRGYRQAELDRIRKATRSSKDAELIGRRFHDQDAFATQELRRQVETIAPGDGVEVGVRKAKQASESIFEGLDANRKAEADRLYGKVRASNRLIDLRPVRQRMETILSSETIPKGEKEAVQNKALSMMAKRNPDGTLRDAITFDFSNAQQLKFEMDNLIRKRGETSIGKNAERALIEAKEVLIDEIERAAPGYKAANKAYHEATKEIDAMEETLVGVIRDTQEPRLSRVMSLFNDKDISNVLALKGQLDSVDPTAYYSLYKGWISDLVAGIKDLEGSRNASRKIWDRLMAQPKTWNRINALSPSKTISSNLGFLRDYIKYAKEIRLGKSFQKGFIETGADIVRTKEVQGPVAASIKALSIPFDRIRANAMTEAILNPKWELRMKGIREATPSRRFQLFESLMGEIGLALRTGTGGYDIGEGTQLETLEQLNQQQEQQ